MEQTMTEYLTALIEEKGSSLDTEIQVEGHIGITYQNLVEFIEQVPKEMQSQIKDMLVKIDFHNGDVFDYLNHLVEGMAKQLEADMGM